MSDPWSVENLIFFLNVYRFSLKCPTFLVEISENLPVLVKIMLINLFNYLIKYILAKLFIKYVMNLQLLATCFGFIEPSSG